MSSESLITTDNALFSASEDEGSHLPTPGYSPSGATLPKRLSDAALDAGRTAVEVGRRKFDPSLKAPCALLKAPCALLLSNLEESESACTSLSS